MSIHRGLTLPVDDKPRSIAGFDVLGQRQFAPGSPAGWPDRSDDWDGASALMRRIEFADAVMAASLTDWRAATDENGLQWAAFSLQSLQTFDALSLWFCCAERTAPESFAVPNSSVTTFMPGVSQEVTRLRWC